MPDDAVGDAPEEEALETVSAVRAEDDQVRLPGVGAVEDLAPGVANTNLRPGDEMHCLKAALRVGHELIDAMASRFVVCEHRGCSPRSPPERELRWQLFRPFVDVQDSYFSVLRAKV